MKILIVEDDTLQAAALRCLLLASGFEADTVCDGEEGCTYSLTGVYDLIILDVMMPCLNGFQVARRVREARLPTPILMLTARSGLEDRLEGLAAGADYYLPKPFDDRELMACIGALLRRQGSCVNELCFGNTVLSLSASTLRTPQQSIRLSHKEFGIMRILMSSDGAIVSKETLLCRVWGFDSAAIENNVEVYIGLLRKKLRCINSNIHIRALRSQGYILETSTP